MVQFSVNDTSKSSGQSPHKAPARESVVSFYVEGRKIYPRSVSGLLNRWRWAMVWITQIVFYGLPWLQWNDRQAVLFYLQERRFYLFDWVLYPHDLIYLTALLIICALALFLFTAVAGRLWCGYACPQTVYTEIYLWIERKVEGDRLARMRLDQGPWSAAKLGKKGLKQFLWVAFGLWTGFTFVGYFTPIDELGAAVLGATLGPWQTFWILFYGLATYGNAGYLREAVCLHMCPYARFQSAMFDKDTLIVTYDQQRGEPRGSRSKSADPTALGLGACVDCTLCVQVCPTGIDIRNGLQYECIGCGACIDVCDTVMDKMGYARGLVKYSTENAMLQGWTGERMLRRALRPRVLIYSALLLGLCIALATSMAHRVPLKLDVLRDAGSMSRMVGPGYIENVYRLQIRNATEKSQTFSIAIHGLSGAQLMSADVVEVLPLQSRSLPVRVQVPPGLASGAHPIYFVLVADSDADLRVEEKSVFFVSR